MWRSLCTPQAVDTVRSNMQHRLERCRISLPSILRGERSAQAAHLFLQIVNAISIGIKQKRLSNSSLAICKVRACHVCQVSEASHIVLAGGSMSLIIRSIVDNSWWCNMHYTVRISTHS